MSGSHTKHQRMYLVCCVANTFRSSYAKCCLHHTTERFNNDAQRQAIQKHGMVVVFPTTTQEGARPKFPKSNGWPSNLQICF
ncbi:hypothetical protein EV363DRAFT_1215475 [Boletus edulis]|nr:hypothetical protein EV363DRAFT_1215475 [Boletus edulis]